MMKQFIKDLEELRDVYDSGEMMSMKEAIDGRVACEIVLEKAKKLDENDNLSDLSKIGRVRLFLEEIDPDRQELKYQIRNHLDEVIDKYVHHTARTLKMNNQPKKSKDE